MPEGFKNWQKEGHPSGDAIIRKAKNEGKLFSDGYREEELEMRIEGVDKVTTIPGVDDLKKEHSVLYKKDGMSNEDVATELENIRHEGIKTALEVLKEQKKHEELYKKYNEKAQIADKRLELIEQKVKELGDIIKERDLARTNYSFNKRKKLDMQDHIRENRCVDLYEDDQIQMVMPKNILTRFKLLISKIPFLRSSMLEPYARELSEKEVNNLQKEQTLSFEKLADLEEKIDEAYSTIELEKKIFTEEDSQLNEIINKGKADQEQLLKPKLRRLKALTGFNNKDSDNDEQSLN